MKMVLDRGNLKVGDRLLQKQDISGHSKKGQILVVEKISGGGNFANLSGCVNGKNCECLRTGYSINDDWFELYNEKPITYEESQAAKPLPAVDDVRNDMMRMFRMV